VANQVPDLYGDVKKFMVAIADQIGNQRDTRDSTLDLRIKLIREESDEVIEAIGNLGVVERLSDNPDTLAQAFVAKELCDLLYVTIGAFVALDLPYEMVWDLVHASNMTKVDGHKDPETGKWIKPEGYVGPYRAIEGLIKLRRWLLYGEGEVQ
jgi:predicted HAD superfamily Cof-like phosphohydrolase